MTKLLFAALLPLLPAAARSAEDCGTTSEACAPAEKKVTPFMAELKKASAPPSSPAPAVKAAPAAVPAAPETDPVPAAARERGAARETFLKPGWLLAAGALLAALYYFLKDGRKKRRRS
jgi:hypothetical protein